MKIGERERQPSSPSHSRGHMSLSHPVWNLDEHSETNKLLDKMDEWKPRAEVDHPATCAWPPARQI